MRLRPIGLSVYFRFSIHLLHAGPNADSDERYSDCDDNDSNHGITARPFIPRHKCENQSLNLDSDLTRSHLIPCELVQEFGWVCPANAEYFARVAELSELSLIFIVSWGF